MLAVCSSTAAGACAPGKKMTEGKDFKILEATSFRTLPGRPEMPVTTEYQFCLLKKTDSKLQPLSFYNGKERYAYQFETTGDTVWVRIGPQDVRTKEPKPVETDAVAVFTYKAGRKTRYLLVNVLRIKEPVVRP